MGMLNGALAQTVQHGLPVASLHDIDRIVEEAVSNALRRAGLGSLLPATAPAEGGGGGGKGRRVLTAPGFGDLPDGMAYDPSAGTIRGQVSVRGRTCSITVPIAGHNIADVVNAVKIQLDAARLQRDALELVPELAIRARDLAAQVCAQFRDDRSYASTRKVRAAGPTPSRVRP